MKCLTDLCCLAPLFHGVIGNKVCLHVLLVWRKRPSKETGPIFKPTSSFWKYVVLKASWNQAFHGTSSRFEESVALPKAPMAMRSSVRNIWRPHPDRHLQKWQLAWRVTYQGLNETARTKPTNYSIGWNFYWMIFSSLRYRKMNCVWLFHPNDAIWWHSRIALFSARLVYFIFVWIFYFNLGHTQDYLYIETVTWQGELECLK